MFYSTTFAPAFERERRYKMMKQTFRKKSSEIIWKFKINPSTAVKILPVIVTVLPISVERALLSCGISVRNFTPVMIVVPNSIVDGPSTFNLNPIISPSCCVSVKHQIA